MVFQLTCDQCQFGRYESVSSSRLRQPGRRVPIQSQGRTAATISGSRTLLKIDNLYKRLMLTTSQETSACAFAGAGVPARRKSVKRRARRRVQTVSWRGRFHDATRGTYRDAKIYFCAVSSWREIDRPQDTNRTTTTPNSADANLQHLCKKLNFSPGVRFGCNKWFVSNPQNLVESKSQATTFCVLSARDDDRLSTNTCG